MRAVVWEAYILCIKPPDVCAKARCHALMLSGKAHSVALFNVSYSHRRCRAAPSRTGSNWLLFGVRVHHLIPLPKLPSLAQADAMEFSGHGGFCFAISGQQPKLLGGK